jgi:hypothetical protein
VAAVVHKQQSGTGRRSGELDEPADVETSGLVVAGDYDDRAKPGRDGWQMASYRRRERGDDRSWVYWLGGS